MTSAPWEMNGGSLRLIVEGVGELALLGLLVPSEDLHVLLVVLVVAGHAVGESVHEDRDGREFDSAEGSDLAGLGVGRGRVPGEVGRLVRVEDEGACVLGLVLECGVDDGELLVRVGLRGVFDRFGQLESHADRQIAFGVDHRLHVGGEVVVGFRLRGVGPHAEVVNGFVQAFLGRLVERLVVPSPGVGDDAGSIVDLLCRGALQRAFLRRGALSRFAAAAGAERQCRNAEKRGNFAVLHACFSWLCASASEKRRGECDLSLRSFSANYRTVHVNFPSPDRPSASTASLTSCELARVVTKSTSSMSTTTASGIPTMTTGLCPV